MEFEDKSLRKLSVFSISIRRTGPPAIRTAYPGIVFYVHTVSFMTPVL